MAMGKKGSLDGEEWSVVQKDETASLPPSPSLPRLDRDPVSVKITPPLIREGSHLDRGDFRPFCMASSAVCAAVSLSSENKEMSDDDDDQKEVWEDR